MAAHLDYLRDIENPEGYKRAMENVQKKFPIHRRSVVLTREYQISPDDASPQPTLEHGMITSPGLVILIELQLTFPPNHLHLRD